MSSLPLQVRLSDSKRVCTWAAPGGEDRPCLGLKDRAIGDSLILFSILNAPEPSVKATSCALQPSGVEWLRHQTAEGCAGKLP